MRNGFSQPGAPEGRKWANTECWSFIKLEVTSAIHNVKANGKVIINWEVSLKTYGRIPKVFSTIRKRKSVTIIEEKEEIFFPEVRAVCCVITSIIFEKR